MHVKVVKEEEDKRRQYVKTISCRAASDKNSQVGMLFRRANLKKSQIRCCNCYFGGIEMRSFRYIIVRLPGRQEVLDF